MALSALTLHVPGWNIFDFVVVSLSLIALGPWNISPTVIRTMRALRVVRIFRRVKSLRKIVAALSTAVFPVLNAMLVLFIAASICKLRLDVTSTVDV